MRQNGFQRPWHPLQVTSWAVFLLQGISFHVLLLPCLASPLHRGVLAAAFWCLAAPMFVWGARMTSSDPIDPHVREARLARSRAWKPEEHGGAPPPALYDYPLASETDQERDARRYDPDMQGREAERNWCPYCCEHVDTTSKHCRLCDKCTHVFDHHCKWLNTCVGGVNYRLFFMSMTFALLMMAYQLAIAIFLFISTFLYNYEGEGASSYIRDAYGAFHGWLLQVLLAALIFLSTPLVLSLLQLFLLHIYLCKRNITTYEWIMERRRALLAKEAAAKELQAQKEAQTQGVAMVTLVTPKERTPMHTSAEEGATGMQHTDQGEQPTHEQQYVYAGGEQYADNLRVAHGRRPSQQSVSAAVAVGHRSQRNSISRGVGGLNSSGMPLPMHPLSERVPSFMSQQGGVSLVNRRTLTAADVAWAQSETLQVASAGRHVAQAGWAGERRSSDGEDDPARTRSPSPSPSDMRLGVALDGHTASHSAISLPLQHGLPVDASDTGGSFPARHRSMSQRSQRAPGAHLQPLSTLNVVVAPAGSGRHLLPRLSQSASRTRGSPHASPMDADGAAATPSGFGLASPSGVALMSGSPPLPASATPPLPPCSSPSMAGTLQGAAPAADAAAQPSHHAHPQSPSAADALPGYVNQQHASAMPQPGGAHLAPLASHSAGTLAPQLPLTPTYARPTSGSRSSGGGGGAELAVSAGASHSHLAPPAMPASDPSLGLDVRPMSAASLEAEADAFLADPRDTQPKLYHVAAAAPRQDSTQPR